MLGRGLHALGGEERTTMRSPHLVDCCVFNVSNVWPSNWLRASRSGGDVDPAARVLRRPQARAPEALLRDVRPPHL